MLTTVSREVFQVRNDRLSEQQKAMSDVTISPADEAAGWAEGLIRKAHRGPGDTVDAAMHRVSTKHGIKHQTLWKLRYRRPSDLMASVYLKIKAAYESECSRQEARLAHELEITKALPPTPARAALVREAEAVLGLGHQQEGE